MGKEADLLNAVKNNDHQKLQKLLLPERGYQVKKTPKPSSTRIPGGRIRVKLDHININCRESTGSSGYTPLLLAVEHGNKDIAETLLFHSADVDFPDNKGNTPLHLAVFAGKIDMVDLLLQHNAKVDIQNSDGNTSIHIISQCDYEHRIKVMLKLLKVSSTLYTRNKAHATPLDVAAMYNKKDIMSIMLDHDSSLKYNTTAIIESAIRGYTEIVQLLLDYGVSPNGISDLKETGPLHEATRFCRTEVARILLNYGANPAVRNMKNESPKTLAEGLPKVKSEELLKLFEESRVKGATATPRFTEKDNEQFFATPGKCYPQLPTDPSWTRNTPEYCNSSTPNNPNTNLFDGNMRTFWIMQDTHYAWTVLDLHQSHTLTGITIYGWDSPEMVKCFEIQRGIHLKGPWTTTGSFICKRTGSTNPKEDAVAQSFKDFEASSRYWRLQVLSNYGGSYTCFQGVALNGSDDRVTDTLSKLGFSKYVDQFICKGCNTYRKFLLQDDTDLQEVCTDEDVSTLSTELKKLRKSEFKLTNPKWKQPPPYSWPVGKCIPDMVVVGDIGCSDEMTMSVKDGIYRILVHSKSNPDIMLSAPTNIEIKPPSNLSKENKDAFESLETMLSDLASSLDLPS
ncbi:caskin-1-like isoform X2 [Ylistrum balloti]|uniref:caskin-1-like isoform X2 n=1 Tax=Ylistrum balloti TaxID=509963 RepID=UPI002905E9E0|nr:caskin-1-like isoform X2 [Ylistrum balloti]